MNELIDRVRQIVLDEGDRDTRLQAVCDLLHAEVPHYDWVGFYLVEPGSHTLVLGPYTGEPTEHIRISFGSGICGQAAETQKTFVVQDVSQETNYLSCSPEVRSEIVLPVMRDGVVVGELDIDSHALSPFTDEDQMFLSQVCEIVSKLL